MLKQFEKGDPLLLSESYLETCRSEKEYNPDQSLKVIRKYKGNELVATRNYGYDAAGNNTSDTGWVWA